MTDDPIEAGYDAVYLWAKAVEKAGSTDVDKVKEAAGGIEFSAPEARSQSTVTTSTCTSRYESVRSMQTV